jgi:hypothetical protein
MYRSADFHGLFLQLQTRFPGSGLITELVQIHAGVFIVKAVVMTGGTPLASALSAAEAVEVAEDQARLRVLGFLGIVAPGNLNLENLTALNGNASQPTVGAVREDLSRGTIAITPQPAPDPSLEPIPTLDQIPGLVKGIQRRPEKNHATDPVDASLSAELSDDLPSEDWSVSEFYEGDLPDEDRDGDSFATTQLTSPPERDEPAIAAPPKASAIKTTKTKNQEKAIAPSMPSHSDNEPDDLSSLIAQTDVEMDRIGWTKLEGRDYLKQTYGKATRQRLEVDELLDFLNHLKALPSPYGL